MSLRANNYYKAKSLEDAYNKLQENPKNAIIAGGLWMKKTGLSYETLIDLSELGLDKIEEKAGYIHVGAMVSLRDFENSPLINSLFSGATAFGVREILGPAFRNSATIGGSVYGKYGFSDVITGLLGYKVDLVFYPEAVVSLLDYVNKPGFYDGILTHVRIYKEDLKAFFKKVGITALDYPILNVAVTKGKEYRVVVGSRPLVAARCLKAEAYLNEGGKDFARAAELALEELKFGDSIATKGEYRKQLALTYVRRGLEEVNR